MPRIERDFLGEKELPDDAYYGVQTLRGKENFHITGISMASEPHFVRAFGYVKKAAAMANRELGVLDPRVADGIIHACDRLIAGELRDQFVTDFIQGGAGTSTNMNANEVIANVALEYLGHARGEYHIVNPNDHVNFGQSTNDVYPTALRLALILRLGAYMEALRQLQASFTAKGPGVRSCPQDGPHASAGCRPHVARSGIQRVGHDHRRRSPADRRGPLVAAGDQPRGHGHRDIRDGGARVSRTRRPGTWLRLPASSSSSRTTWWKPPPTPARTCQLSGVLKRTSAKLTKICNDLRLLGSGPRCGFNEINLPQMQPGSSIMPGKVNPVIPEVVNQTGFLVIGLDLTVTLAASAGQLQLNVMEPVISFALFSSISTMENAVNTLRERCIDGITANASRTRDMVLNSLGIVTLLKPKLGYKVCGEIAKESFTTDRPLRDIVVNERRLLTEAEWDELFSFENLINPDAGWD